MKPYAYKSKVEHYKLRQHQLIPIIVQGEKSLSKDSNRKKLLKAKKQRLDEQKMNNELSIF